MAAPFLSMTVAGRTYELPKNNLAATVDPVAGDDDADGYSPGSAWVNITLKKVFFNVVNTGGAAEWFSAGGTAYTDEQAQDAVAAAFAAGTHDAVTVTYNDGSNSISLANTDKGSSAVSTHVAASDPHTQYQLRSEKDTANGYASLDASGLIPAALLPAIALQEFLGAVASQSAMLALTGQRGDWCTRTDTGTDFQLIGEPSSTLSNWRERTYPASPVTSVAGRTGAVTLSSSDISGLGTAATQNSTAFQSADSTLTALAAFNTNGIICQTAADTFTGRTLTGTTNRVTITNGDGVSGNPTVDIHSSYAGQTSITTLGTITTGTWNGTTIDVARGGTGLTSYAVGDLITATASTTLSKLAAVAANNVLRSTGVASVPAWGKVANDDMANMALGTIKARVTSTSGPPEDIDGISLCELLPWFVGSGASNRKGLVPPPGSTAGTTRFLREDATWVAASGDYILVRDEKAVTDGGTFTSGAWRTRTINTEVSDTGGHCSIASNQITLAAGTYRVLASCPALRVGSHQARLQNVTDGSTTLVGSTAQNSDGASYAMTASIIVGQFTITASKAFELQHYCATTRATFGFGLSSGFAQDIYAWAEFIKIG